MAPKAIPLYRRSLRVGLEEGEESHDHDMAHSIPATEAAQSIRRVWIAPGCIACGWCGDLLPSIFVRSPDGFSLIAGSARKDGKTDPNDGPRSALRAKIVTDEADFLAFVAAGCPPAVIHFD